VLVFDDEDGGGHGAMLHRVEPMTGIGALARSWYPTARSPGRLATATPGRRAAAHPNQTIHPS
jgi:hypothetical protein